MFRRVTKERRSISTAVALTLSGKIYKKHFEGSVNSENLVLAVEHMRSQIQDRKIILIWDRARIHKVKLQNVIYNNILKSSLKNYRLMLRRSILKNIVMAMSNNISGMPAQKQKRTFVPCSISGLPACGADPT